MGVKNGACTSPSPLVGSLRAFCSEKDPDRHLLSGFKFDPSPKLVRYTLLIPPLLQ